MTKGGICILCKEEVVELTEHHATNKPDNSIMILSAVISLLMKVLKNEWLGRDSFHHLIQKNLISPQFSTVISR